MEVCKLEGRRLFEACCLQEVLSRIEILGIALLSEVSTDGACFEKREVGAFVDLVVATINMHT